MDVLHSDCLAYLGNQPSERFDLIIADPPYYEICGEFDYAWSSVEDYLDWCYRWVRACHRCLKPTGAMYIWGKIGFNKGFAFPRLVQWIEEEGLFVVRNWITQRNTRGRGTKKGFMEAREELVFLTKGDDFTWNVAYTEEKSNRSDPGFDGKPRKNVFKRCSDVWIDIAEASQSSKQRFHLPDGTAFPTVKPLKACKRIVAASTNPSDLVYIPFGGSGSEAIACQSLGRRWVYTETNIQYVDLAANRLLADGAAVLPIIRTDPALQSPGQSYNRDVSHYC